VSTSDSLEEEEYDKRDTVHSELFEEIAGCDWCNGDLNESEKVFKSKLGGDIVCEECRESEISFKIEKAKHD